MNKYVPAKLRQFVERRANGCCEYCRSQERFSPQSFSVEHILPRQSGGTTVEENLALSCQGCNNHKAIKTSAVDPATSDIAPLFNPRQQKWFEHFAWNVDSTVIVGLTPIGRATVEVLQLNRNGLVNLRRVLYAMNEHPPQEIEADS
jgi:hypothetical protein